GICSDDWRRADAEPAGPSTHVSLLPPPRCMDTTNDRSWVETRVNPPGRTTYDCPFHAAYTRRTRCRGAIPLSTRTGTVESATRSWATNCSGEASIRRTNPS